MNLREALWNNLTLPGLVLKGVHVLMIAITFEVIAWWLGRSLDRITAQYQAADTGREQSWRLRRRAQLKKTPRIIARAICYGTALILIFDVFGVPVLALSLAVGSIIALVGAAMLPLLRDFSQGYALLAEDALALGDTVNINGHNGVVERFSLRSVTLRDAEGNAHILNNNRINEIVVVKRRAETPAIEYTKTAPRR